MMLELSWLLVIVGLLGGFGCAEKRRSRKVTKVLGKKRTCATERKEYMAPKE